MADRPKSMALIQERPFLEIQMLQLRSQGVRRVVLGTGYMGGQIEAYFGDGAAWGMEVAYSCEKQPLGTGGAMRLAAEKLSDPCLILNGDSFVEFDLAGMLAVFRAKSADLVMAVREVPDASRYGGVDLGPDGRLLAFREKSTECRQGWINAGVYLVRKELIEAIPPGCGVSFEKETMPGLLSRSCHAYQTSGVFIDIGLPEDYARAQDLLANKFPDKPG